MNEQLANYFMLRFGKMPICSLCTGDQWVSTPESFQVLESMNTDVFTEEGEADLSVMPVPVYVCTCVECGHTLLFHQAIVEDTLAAAGHEVDDVIT